MRSKSGCGSTIKRRHRNEGYCRGPLWKLRITGLKGLLEEATHSSIFVDRNWSAGGAVAKAFPNSRFERRRGTNVFDGVERFDCLHLSKSCIIVPRLTWPSHLTHEDQKTETVYFTRSALSPLLRETSMASAIRLRSCSSSISRKRLRIPQLVGTGNTCSTVDNVKCDHHNTLENDALWRQIHRISF